MIRPEINVPNWENYRRLEEAAAAYKDHETAIRAVREITAGRNKQTVWVPDYEYQNIVDIYTRKTPLDEALKYFYATLKDACLKAGMDEHTAESEAWRQAADTIEDIYNNGREEIKPYSNNPPLAAMQDRLIKLDVPLKSSSPAGEVPLYAILAGYMACKSEMQHKTVTIRLYDLCVHLGAAVRAIKSNRWEILRKEPFERYISVIKEDTDVAKTAKLFITYLSAEKQQLADVCANTQITLTFNNCKAACDPPVFTPVSKPATLDYEHEK